MDSAHTAPRAYRLLSDLRSHRFIVRDGNIISLIDIRNKTWQRLTSHLQTQPKAGLSSAGFA
jgi:hypothetical protein